MLFRTLAIIVGAAAITVGGALTALGSELSTGLCACVTTYVCVFVSRDCAVDGKVLLSVGPVLC